MARLAALRFEERPPLTDEAWGDWATTLDLAGRMAPRNASVQGALGELLVRMGKPAEGLAAYSRALQLDPSMARRAVPVLSAFGVDPNEALDALPRSPVLLLALREMYARENRLSEYADVIEPNLVDGSPELLAAWTDARLASSQEERIVRTLQHLSVFPQPEREAARRVQLSRAYLALSDLASADAWAERARAAAPSDSRALEQSARVALASQDPDGAVRFAREALTALARQGAGPGARAWVYELSGQAEERRGRMDAAHDAYSHALALDPNRTTSRRRLNAMRAEAGLSVPSQAP